MRRVGRRATNFQDIGAGALGLVTDSYGMIALCFDRRSAAEELQISASDQVVLEDVGDENPTGLSTPVNLRINR